LNIDSQKSIDSLIAHASDGDKEALAELFCKYKDQLRRMVAFRLDQNLRGRIDPSDVLQEAYVDLAQRLNEFGKKDMSFYVWLRLVTHERLLRIHRQHLGAQKRDARREIANNFSQASAISLAAHLMGKYTSVCGKAIRAEQSLRLHQILAEMDDNDREIIALRMFEGLTNGETAEVLGLAKQTTSKRFIRAIGNIREEIKDLPGFG
jgi:RNA polymerase sigma-70 factor (ECF subfamily)